MLTNAGKDQALQHLFVEQMVYLDVLSGKKALGQRQQIAFSQPQGADRHVENERDISFLIVRAQTVDGWQIMDSLGDVLAEGALEEPMPMRNNEEVIFRPGDIALRIDG